MGQLEQGEQGTRHYQLCVRTPQVRFSALKKRFPTAHIEVARSVPALMAYVEKSESRVAKLADTSDKYPSLSRFWILVSQELNDGTKDGLNYDSLEEERIEFFTSENQKMWKKKPLHFLDYATRILIKKGYHVEGIGANPNTRSQWNLFGEELILRSIEAKNKEDMEHNRNDDTTALGEGQESELPQACGVEVPTTTGSEHSESEGSTGHSGQDDY